jgi:neutral trehalase
MSIQLSKPKSLIDLSTCAVLVNVRTSVWTGVQTDDEVSNEITTMKNADSESGKFAKRLLAGDREHKKLVNHRQTVRNWVKRRTFPWAGQWNILPVVTLPQFMEEYKALDKEREELLEAFLQSYPNKVSDMAFKLNGMFRREDYPTADELRDKFTMTLYTAEVPQGDFRVQIAHDLADDLTNHFNKQAQSTIDNMLSQQIHQLVDVMRSISHTCGENVVEREDGSLKVSRGRLHTETLKKALQYCDTFKQFNPAGDSRLDAIRNDLERVLINVDMDELKKNDSTRAYVKAEVDDILSKFGFGQ